MKHARSNQWLPIVVILVVAIGVGGAAYWTIASAKERADGPSTMTAEQFAAALDHNPGTDQGCIDCHTDREALTADLERNPVEVAEKSSESEGEG